MNYKEYNNKDYFPTPDSLIDKMLMGVNFRKIRTILEPSAGKGAIVDYLEKKRGSSWDKYSYQIDCVELDNDMKSVLAGKNYHVVHDDFLTYNTYKQYDLIVANVPFSNGAKHLLKIIEMQERNGGAFIAICNAETIRNQSTNERFLLCRKLEQIHAELEFIKGAFLTSDTERKSDVEVCMIKAQLPTPERKQSIIMDGLRKSETVRETTENTYDGQIVKNDFIKAIISQYNLECAAGCALIDEYEAMKPYILSSFVKNEDGSVEMGGGAILTLNTTSTNEFLENVRMKYWSALFHNEEFTGKLTSNILSEYRAKIRELKDYDFSLFNIMEIQKRMTSQIVKGVEDTILDLFDELSYKHSYDNKDSQNIHYYNGWRTNKSYMINSKVVIPYSAFESLYDGTKRFKPAAIHYGYGSNLYAKLMDIEKVFNYLDNGKTEPVDLNSALSEAQKNEQTKNIDTKYFKITCFKKGTTHLVFKDLELLKKFNIFGSQKKGWLPYMYGEKYYSDMTAEEKAVVNEFDGGEAEYNKVMCCKKYYFVNIADNIKLIG